MGHSFFICYHLDIDESSITCLLCLLAPSCPKVGSACCLIWEISRKLDTIHIIFIYPTLIPFCLGAQLLGRRLLILKSLF
jgi:hypothetical protein